MSGILRQVTAFGGKVVLGVMLLALLTPPFGLRAYLEARAQEQAQAAQVMHSFGRPVAAVVKVPVTARPFAQAPRSPLDGVKGKGAWLMIFDGDWNDPDADRAAAIVESAVRAGLSDLHIRIAESRRHFHGAPAPQALPPDAPAPRIRNLRGTETMRYRPTPATAPAPAAG